MRIIMMGTGAFAVPAFEALIASKHEIIALVTRPSPAVRTRGKAPTNPMREVAEARAIAILTPENVNAETTGKQLRSLRPDLLVVCDYGQILSAATLSIAPLGGINLHGSLLPKYRGAAPVQWALISGEAETGVTVIHMTPKLDAGPILASRLTRIADDETAEQLEPRLAKLGVPAVMEAIQTLEAWDQRAPLGKPQDQALACRAPRLKKSDGQVDWSQSARSIYNRFRALQPWPGCFTLVPRQNAESLRLILSDVSVAGSAVEPRAAAGEVVAAGDELLVATRTGLLSIARVQPAGKRVMTVSEFLRGHPLPIGTRLGT